MDLLLQPFRVVYDAVGALFSLLLVIVWVVTLVHCLTRKVSSSEKIAWFLVIFFGNLIGAALYFLLANKKSR